MHADSFIAPQSGGASRREISSSVMLAAEHLFLLEKTLFVLFNPLLFISANGRWKNHAWSCS